MRGIFRGIFRRGSSPPSVAVARSSTSVLSSSWNSPRPVKMPPVVQGRGFERATRERGRDGVLTDRTCDSRRGPLGARPRPPGFPQPHAAAVVHVTPAKRSRLQLPLTPPGLGLRSSLGGLEQDQKVARGRPDPIPTRWAPPQTPPRHVTARPPRPRAPRARPPSAAHPVRSAPRGIEAPLAGSRQFEPHPSPVVDRGPRAPHQRAPPTSARPAPAACSALDPGAPPPPPRPPHCGCASPH